MMKKITRIAALLATAALLLAGFPACGDDDGDDEPTPAAPVDTVTPASFELTSGADAESKTFTLTLGTTQIKADKLVDLKKGDLPAELIDAIVQQSGSDIIVSKVALTEDATATTLKLSLTMASAAAGGKKGTLTLTLPANFTENGKDITGTLNYEIKGSTTTPPGEEDSDKTNKPYVLNLKLSTDDVIEGTDKKIDDVVTVRSTAKNNAGTTNQKIKFNKNGYIEMGGAQAKPNYGLEITFAKAATVKTKVTKKSGGTAKKAVLVKTDWSEDGKTPIVVAETNGIDDYDKDNTADTVTERTIEVTEPGTYVFGSDSNGCFVYSLVINWKD